MTIEELTRAYELEQQSSGPATTADDVPVSYEAITPEWFTAVLCADHPGAAVTGFTLGERNDGNSNRRRVFLEYNAAGQDAGLPATVFCKATHNLANRVSLGLTGGLTAEINFYTHTRALLDVESPVSLFAKMNPETLNSIIVMVDLTDHATFCTHTTEFTRDRAEGQIRLLAQVHGRFLESPDLDGVLQAFPTWPEWFARLDYPGFEQACDKGFERSEEMIPARVFAQRDKIWPLTRASVELHKDLPATLTHGDDHQRNWYIRHDGSMGLCDWQSTTRGHWARDLAYALSTSLTIEDRRAWEQDLLRLYLDELQSAAGRTIPVDGVLDHYRRQLMTVLAYWTVTVNPAPGMPDMQPMDSSLEFVRRISTAMDDLDTIRAFD